MMSPATVRTPPPTAIQRLERRESIVVSASGSMEQHLGARSEADRSLATEAFNERKIVRHGDVDKDQVHDRETYGARSFQSTHST